MTDTWHPLTLLLVAVAFALVAGSLLVTFATQLLA